MSRLKFKQEYLCEFVEPNRCTGRTTAIALELMSAAIKASGEWVRGFDHYPGRAGQVTLRNTIQDIAEGARLEFETRLSGREPHYIVEVRSTRKR